MRDNACNKEVPLLRFEQFVVLVLFQSWKKNDTKKLDSDVSVVSSNDGSVVPAKKRLRLGKIKNVKIFLLEKYF